MTDAPDVPRCLPPDLSVPGLWWVRCDDGLQPEWETWRWLSDCICWWRGSGSVEPDTAAERGWRCIAPAVPPSPPVRSCFVGSRDWFTRARAASDATELAAGDFLYDALDWLEAMSLMPPEAPSDATLDPQPGDPQCAHSPS